MHAQMHTHLLGQWVHDLSPFALRLSGDFGIRWYGLSYGLGFLVGWFVLRWLAARGRIGLSVERVGDLMIAVMLGVIVGGRLGYVVFYQPALLWDFSAQFPFWGVLQLTRGGMASHGGMIGVVVAAWIIARGARDEMGRRVGRVPMWHVGDCLAAVAPAGLFFGRLANFINGELLGRVVAAPGEPGPAWAVKFPQELIDGHAPRLNADQTAQLAAILERFRLPSEASLSYDEFFRTGVARLIATIQSGTSQGQKLAADVAPLLASRHPSQLYQAAAEGIVMAALLWLIWRVPRLPGVVSAWFLIVYGLLRIATEFYRLPDAHLQLPRVLGLSRGQWLSALMVVLGGVLLAYVFGRARNRETPKMGGWAR
jgi:phosphatidylglycerol:prolipoprotein diacylglycerol transferase